MALQKDEIDKITGLLSWRISDKELNSIIERINRATFYYEMKDSHFNRPTVWKLFALLVFVFCFSVFVVQPIFFSETKSVLSIIENDVAQTVKDGWLPPLSSFKYQVSVKNVGDSSMKNVLEILDMKGNLISRADMENNYGTAIFGTIGSSTSLWKDADILNDSVAVLSEDKKSSIKEILDKWIRYDAYVPKFESMDYWVDALINWAWE